MFKIEFVNIDDEEASHLADLTGISHDFESTRRFAEQLKEMLEEGGGSHLLHEPMTIAILVRYSRPFLGGKRYHLGGNDLNALSLKQREAHELFHLWRDKHIAHSVNVFEDNQLIARYEAKRFANEGFISVDCNSTVVVGMSLHDVEMVIELATHFIEKLKAQIEHEKKDALERVNARPRDQVLKKAKPARVTSMKDVGKERKQRARGDGQHGKM